jgi:hypothetical protein
MGALYFLFRLLFGCFLLLLPLFLLARFFSLLVCWSLSPSLEVKQL